MILPMMDPKSMKIIALILVASMIGMIFIGLL